MVVMASCTTDKHVVGILSNIKNKNSYKDTFQLKFIHIKTFLIPWQKYKILQK